MHGAQADLQEAKPSQGRASAVDTCPVLSTYHSPRCASELIPGRDGHQAPLSQHLEIEFFRNMSNKRPACLRMSDHIAVPFQ